MDIEHAVVQAIHDNPSDETSWLVLADWLEENGQADRAEMLRLNRQLRPLQTDSERKPLEDRFQKLLRAGVVPYAPTVTNSIGMKLALIPPGHFWLGSPETEKGRYGDESPRQRIELTRPFYLAVYLVTQDEYRKVRGNSPSAFSATGSHAASVAEMDTSRFPVEEITWADAMAFCDELSRFRAEQKAKRVYRLPTEVEWEYACRGGAAMTTLFPHGKRMTCRYANFKHATRSKDKRRQPLGRTSEVGSYPPNGSGQATWSAMSGIGVPTGTSPMPTHFSPANRPAAGAGG